MASGVTTRTTTVAAFPAVHGGLPDGYESWDAYYDDLEVLEHLWRDEDAQRGLKAMRLAPSLGICRALLNDEPVPRSWLDQEWAKRYRL